MPLPRDLHLKFSFMCEFAPGPVLPSAYKETTNSNNPRGARINSGGFNSLLVARRLEGLYICLPCVQLSLHGLAVARRSDGPSFSESCS